MIDLFLIPGMNAEASARYAHGELDYRLAWVLFLFLEIFGVHRFDMGRWVSGVIYLLTGELFLVGWVYDLLTLNDHISEINRLRS